MAHASLEELFASIVEASALVHIGSSYQHYKQPSHIYKVKEFVIIEATAEVGVVYELQETECVMFVRPLGDFLAVVEWEGNKVPRFKKL